MDTTDIETAIDGLQTAVSTALATEEGQGTRTFTVGDFRLVVDGNGDIVEVRHR